MWNYLRRGWCNTVQYVTWCSIMAITTPGCAVWTTRNGRRRGRSRKVRVRTQSTVITRWRIVVENARQRHQMPPRCLGPNTDSVRNAVCWSRSVASGVAEPQHSEVLGGSGMCRKRLEDGGTTGQGRLGLLQLEKPESGATAEKNNRKANKFGLCATVKTRQNWIIN